MEATVLSSLVLLGMPYTEYRIPVLTTGSFSGSSSNERALLSCLHFLLSRLVGELTFATSMKGCFPYRNAAEKIRFRKAVQTHLQVFVDAGQLPPAATRSSMLMTATGLAVWEMLWTLTDMALEGGDDGDDGDGCATIGSGSGNGQKKKRRTAAEERVTISAVCRDVRWAQRDRAEYSSALDRRLGLATKTIESSKAKIREAVKQDKDGALSQAGKLARTEKMVRINGTTVVLRNMIQTLGSLLTPVAGRAHLHTEFEFSGFGVYQPLEGAVGDLLGVLDTMDPAAVDGVVNGAVAATNAAAADADRMREDSVPLLVRIQELTREVSDRRRE